MAGERPALDQRVSERMGQGCRLGEPLLADLAATPPPCEPARLEAGGGAKPVLVWPASESRLQLRLTLAGLADRRPQPGQGGGEPERRLDVPLVEPILRGSEVVDLGRELGYVRAIGCLGPAQEMLGVTVGLGLGLARLGQPVARIRANGLEHPVTPRTGFACDQ